MVTQFGNPVNRHTKACFQLFCARVEITSAVGARLCRELEHRNVRPDILGKPVTVDPEIDMRDICADPAAPFKPWPLAHRRLQSVRTDSMLPMDR